MAGTNTKADTKTRKADATRHEILMAAAQLFAEKGYSECNLRELADRVGMKAGSFYYHFKSKEEILDELLIASIALISDEVGRAIAALGPDAPIRDRLIAAIRAHTGTFLSRDGHSSTLMRIWDHMPPTMKRRNREKRREYSTLWYDLIEEGRQAGLIRTDIEMQTQVALLIGSMSRATEWFNPKYMTIDQVCDAIIKVNLDGGLTPGLRLADALPEGRGPRLSTL